MIRVEMKPYNAIITDEQQYDINRENISIIIR